MPIFQKDRIAHALLRMLRAVGRYVRRHKAQAHPDAIKRIMSVFSSLEKLVGDPQMTEALKKEIVAKEIADFKKLKQKVESQYGAATQAQTENVPQDFKQAMNAVEQRFSSQVADLKEQLAILQKELDNLRTR